MKGASSVSRSVLYNDLEFYGRLKAEDIPMFEYSQCGDRICAREGSWYQGPRELELLELRTSRTRRDMNI